MLGIWSEAIHIPKRAVNVLNRCGIMVSYDTTRKALTAIAKHDRDMVMAKIDAGRPFGIFWDNLVRMDHKQEETIMNKRSLEQNTSAYIHFLHIPEPSPQADEATRSAYENIQHVVQHNNGVGLPRSLLFKDDGIPSPIDKTLFLADDSLAHHIKEIARLRIGQTFERILGRKVLATYKVDGKQLELPRLPQTDCYGGFRKRPCHLAYCRYGSMDGSPLRTRASERAWTSAREETREKKRETKISFVTETQDSLRPSLSVLKREDTTTCGREAFIPILRSPTSISFKKTFSFTLTSFPRQSFHPPCKSFTQFRAIP
jgi:hypothetical protein